MAQIKNIENLTFDDINRELGEGGRFVVFQYAISIVVMTFQRSSDVYFLRAGEGSAKYSWPFTLLTFVLGWWGIPWGPIYSIGAIYSNLSGGKDVTLEITNHFRQQQATMFQKA